VCEGGRSVPDDAEDVVQRRQLDGVQPRQGGPRRLRVRRRQRRVERRHQHPAHHRTYVRHLPCNSDNVRDDDVNNHSSVCVGPRIEGPKRVRWLRDPPISDIALQSRAILNDVMWDRQRDEQTDKRAGVQQTDVLRLLLYGHSQRMQNPSV